MLNFLLHSNSKIYVGNVTSKRFKDKSSTFDPCVDIFPVLKSDFFLFTPIMRVQGGLNQVGLAYHICHLNNPDSMVITQLKPWLDVNNIHLPYVP